MTRVEELKQESLLKWTLVKERFNLARWNTEHPIGAVNQAFGEINKHADALVALANYTVSLESRINYLEARLEKK